MYERNQTPDLLSAEGKEAIQRTMKNIGLAWENHQETMRRVRGLLVKSGFAPEPPPDDPREYALWLRDNRNTGPAKPHNGRKFP